MFSCFSPEPRRCRGVCASHLKMAGVMSTMLLCPNANRLCSSSINKAPFKSLLTLNNWLGVVHNGNVSNLVILVQL